MKGYDVYSKIKQLKERGFKKAAVAKYLRLNRRTVDRCWETTVDEYEEKHLTVCRDRSLDEYKGTIVGWLQDYPTLSAAQVSDWLKEHYKACYSDRIAAVDAVRKNHYVFYP